MEDLKPKKIYQIFTGVTEEEFYTYCYPVFSADYEDLVCKELIEKLSIEAFVLKRKITANYSSDVLEEKSFKLADGVVIKTIEEEKVIDWITKSESVAKSELQIKELELYRSLVPQMIQTEKSVNGLML